MNRPTPLLWSSLRHLPYVVILAAAISVAGCGPSKKHAPPAHATPTGRPASRPSTSPAGADVRPLYDRLGGTPAVTKVVDDFVALAASDAKVNFARKGQPVAWDGTAEQVTLLKKRLVEFLSVTTGGDLHYNGQDMVTAHRGMNITDAEFDALASDLKAALEKNGVGAREQSELLAVVNRTRSAIVATPGSNNATPTAKAPETPKPPPFVPQPVTSNETELDPEPPAAPDQSNK